MRAEKNKLGVVIVTFNSANEITDCLTSVAMAMHGKKYPIVIVDNASDDQTVEILKSYGKTFSLDVICNKSNIGFAKAVNQGMKRLSRQRVQKFLLLNPDTIVDKNFLNPLLDCGYDLASPVIHFKKAGMDYYDIGGKVRWLLGRQYNVLSRRRPKKLSPNTLDYLSGSCLLIHRKVIDTIGLLDEKYFVYFEDVDYCLRAKKAGFSLGVVPESIIFHKVSASSNQVPKLKRKNLIRSNFLFIGDHVPLFYKPIAYGYLVLLAIKMTLDPGSKVRVIRDH